MTRYTDRKTRIRKLMAAQPGLTHAAAARQIDLAAVAETDAVLATLPPSALAALAAALNTAEWTADAAFLAGHLAWKAAPDPEADRLRQAVADAATALANAPSTLSWRKRQALEDAVTNTSNWLDDHLCPRDQDPYAEEMVAVRAAAAGLRRVASSTDTAAGTAVAAAVADLLDTLFFDFTADAIRYSDGTEFRPIVEPAPTESARHAHLGLHELADAADTPSGSDQDWTACSDHLRKARDHARAAAQPS
jgi:hypothetical protein